MAKECHTIDCTHNTFLLLQKHLTSGTELILIDWKFFLMKVCKLSVCKEPTLYQSVHENISESLLHSLFLHKTILVSPFDLQSTGRFQPFYKLVKSIAFSWTAAFTRTLVTSILWCYNFNGKVKWYGNSCATLYSLQKVCDWCRFHNSNGVFLTVSQRLLVWNAAMLVVLITTGRKTRVAV